MRRHAVVVLALAFVIAAAAPRASAEEKKGSIAGTYTVVSMIRDGEKAPEEKTKEMTVVITDDKIMVKEGDKGHEMTYKIDASKKPHEIDATPLAGPEKDKPHYGIFEMKGDTLKVCMAKTGKDRPTEFSAKKGSDQFCIVLKKSKS